VGIDVVGDHLGDVDVGDAHEGEGPGLVGDQATRAGRLVRLVIIALPALRRYWPSSGAVCGFPRCPAS